MRDGEAMVVWGCEGGWDICLGSLMWYESTVSATAGYFVAMRGIAERWGVDA